MKVTAKLSVSLSTEAAEALSTMAHRYSVPASTVVESSLRSFQRLTEANQKRLLLETGSARSITSLADWRSAFWDALAVQFGNTDPYVGNSLRLYAPRHYIGYLVVYLLDPPNEYPKDIIVHVTEQAMRDAGRIYAIENFKFTLQNSVYEAATTVASWIRTQQALSVDLLFDRLVAHFGVAAKPYAKESLTRIAHITSKTGTVGELQCYTADTAQGELRCLQWTANVRPKNSEGSPVIAIHDFGDGVAAISGT